MSKLYCCYSVPLKNYLHDNGIQYEIVAMNPNSNKTMWVYLKSEELSRLLKEWSNKKIL